MSNAIMLGWNRPAPGREKQAMELFTEMNTWLAKQQQAKSIQSFQPVLLGAHGGDLNGFILISGEPEKLSKLTMSEEWTEMMLRGTVNALGWGVTKAYVGDELMGLMKRYTKYL